MGSIIPHITSPTMSFFSAQLNIQQQDVVFGWGPHWKKHDVLHGHHKTHKSSPNIDSWKESRISLSKLRTWERLASFLVGFCLRVAVSHLKQKHGWLEDLKVSKPSKYAEKNFSENMVNSTFVKGLLHISSGLSPDFSQIKRMWQDLAAFLCKKSSCQMGFIWKWKKSAHTAGLKAMHGNCTEPLPFELIFLPTILDC